MKKYIVALFLGGALIVTMLSGCNGEEQISAGKIEGKFNDFINMFPSDDLTYLYEKEGNIQGEDLGTWVIDSYVNYKEEEKLKGYGAVIFFNRNLKAGRGNFYVYTDATEKEAYPIEYNEKEIHFIEEIKDEDVINKFDKFKLLFEVVSIDRKYLSTLEVQKTYYNKEVPLYGIKYKLLEDDENLNRIKKAYPEFEIEQDEVNLQLEGSGNPHNTHGDQRLIIELNKEDGIYLDASYSFNESEFSKELFKNN